MTRACLEHKRHLRPLGNTRLCGSGWGQGTVHSTTNGRVFRKEGMGSPYRVQAAEYWLYCVQKRHRMGTGRMKVTVRHSRTT